MSKAVSIYKHFEKPTKAGRYHRLLCLSGERKGLSFYVDSNRVLVGRGETADLRIPDVKASREHAEFSIAGQDLWVTDLGSQNGILVNGNKQSQVKLNENDSIVIGSTVFKYSVVSVEDFVPTSSLDEEINGNEDTDSEPKKNPKRLVGVILGLLAIFLLLGEDGDQPKKKQEQTQKYDLSGVGDLQTTAPRRKKKNREVEDKLNTIFRRGLREYREGNYFRAIEEFKHATVISPSDELAEFYRDKTLKALDSKIEEYFLAATRDIDSLKFRSAVVSYCAIMRLLYANKNDERYKAAEEKVRLMEERMGMDEGEVQCIQK